MQNYLKMINNRYPNLGIRSKNELSKRVSGKKIPQIKALELINDSIKNHDKYWRDHPKMSQPDKGKWVRDASYTPLGKLLKLINIKVLRPYDSLLPDFIFGGVGGKNHKAAVKHLLGRKRGRTILKLDITKFFEQIKYDRVYHFFLDKAGCSNKAARLLANICCVAYGAKNNPKDYKTIARGFATSPRLAVWCNLDAFIKIDKLVKHELRGHDPRIAIYVDDIGITASRITKEDLMHIYPKIKAILEVDKNQQLPLNDKKTKIIHHDGTTYKIDGTNDGKHSFEHLGLQMNRNSLTIGQKTRWKKAELITKNNNTNGRSKTVRKKLKALRAYGSYIARKN